MRHADPHVHLVQPQLQHTRAKARRKRMQGDARVANFFVLALQIGVKTHNTKMHRPQYVYRSDAKVETLVEAPRRVKLYSCTGTRHTEERPANAACKHQARDCARAPSAPS